MTVRLGGPRDGGPRGGGMILQALVTGRIGDTCGGKAGASQSAGIAAATGAAVSVGLCNGELLLDLNYLEDKDAAVDANLVMTGRGQFVEVQSSGEESTFSHEQLQGLLGVAQIGLRELTSIQAAFLARALL